MKSRILKNGGSGYLGKQLIAILEDKPIIFDLIEPSFPVDYIAGDVTNFSSVLKACKNIDCMVHLAALHGPHLDRGVKDDEFFSTNFLGTKNVISACEEMHVKSLVFVSSTSVYGKIDQKSASCSMLDEYSKPNPENAYEISKLLAESTIWESNLKKIVLRIARFRYDNEKTLLVNKLSHAVDVRDAAQAVNLSISRIAHIGSSLFVISAKTPFVSSDLQVLWNNPLEKIEEYYPGTINALTMLDIPLPHRISKIYDISRAVAQLGYSPRYNFYESIQYLLPLGSISRR